MLNAADAIFAQNLSDAGFPVKPATPNYLEDPRGIDQGISKFVATPADTEETANIVKACASACVGILPYGGGTGLVSGQIATQGPAPLLLSLEKMNRIRAVHIAEDIMIAEAGCILSDLHNAAEKENRLFPLIYASKDSARLGGGLAVNSGGLNVLRYGMARDLCLGLEAVMPDGSIFNGLKRLRKDNTGYDLRHLLIGSEGTLGIITAAALKLAPKPSKTGTAFLTVPSPEAALNLLGLAKHIAGETISAFELIAKQGLEFLTETLPDVRQPFVDPPDWSVLIELGTGEALDPDALLTTLFEQGLDKGLILDGIISQSGQQRDAFWAVREMIPEANRRVHALISTDISLPLSEIPAFFAEAPPAIQAEIPFRINGFGHLGDGNLHFNVYAPKGEKREDYLDHAANLFRLIHDMVMSKGGSFSAEHGLGRRKAGELQRYADPTKLATMRAIKNAIDPLGIMNPGAVLTDTAALSEQDRTK